MAENSWRNGVVGVRRTRQYGGRVPRTEGGNERRSTEKKKGERPGSHVKVITQTQALTHFSEREALPPHPSPPASSLFLTFEKGACRRFGNKNTKMVLLKRELKHVYRRAPHKSIACVCMCERACV